MSSAETENNQNIEQILDNFCEDKLGENEIVGPQWWSNQTDIVISGISGRFPDAENMKEFMEKLFDGVDMITEDNKRWDPGFYDLPKRHGKLKDLTKFDASFFGMSQEQATVNDPQLNLLLETAYEAIYDSGFDPFSFRGSKTGVYVGNSPLEIASVLLHDWERVNQYTFTGTSRTMLANQLSYCFDFKGPSITFDTACSSTMLALQNAVDAIRKGECDAALVAGAHLTLIPTSAVMFLKLGMLSPQGMCQTFDAKGDGYVRSECVGCVFIQKSTVARRCYATIVHAKSNTDGYKQQGITFPSAQQQATLLKETYKECGTDPNTVTYIEAHGTGTKVGDVIEGSAITAVLAKNREKSALLIGSVKSNAGHAESASGILSLAKVIIALETGMIPHNLHYQEPNVYVPSLTDGRLKVVRENTKWSPDIVGINSFGFGGSNTHIVLKPNYKTEGKTYFDKNCSALPLLLVYSGRTENGLKNVLEKFLEHSNDFYFYNMLLQQSQSQRPDLFPYKGYMLLNKDSMGAAITVVDKQIKYLSKCDVPPIYLSFCGFSSLPKASLKKFCRLEIFHQAFQSCLNDIASLRIEFNNAMKCFLEIVGFQIAFIDVLKHLGVTWQGVIGVCYQEILAKYASCLINRRQTILVAFEFAKHFFGGNKSEGLEYTTSCYSWNQIISRLPVELIDQFAKSSVSHISLSQAEVESSKAIPRESIILQVTVTETSNNIEKRLKCKTITALLNNETDFLNTFFTSLGQLYLYGVNMQINKLYPEVDYPVPRGTPMLSYLFDWDHSQTWNIYTAAQKNLNCVCSFVIDPFSQDSKDSYILDHVIDGRCIYPFTGYLVLAWRAICKLKMIDFNKTSVILENVRVLRATVISKPVKFIVSVTLASGLFEIMEEDQLVACGTVKILTDVSGDRLPFYYENLDKYPIRADAHEETFELNDSDLYKEFRMRGYEYGESFRGIRKACNTGELATLIWTGNWVTFIDSLLQTNLVLEKAYTMRVPIRLEYLRIDPVRHVSSVYEFDCLKVVDARNNIQTFGAIAGGIETYGLVCQTLPIRTWLNRKVTLEWGNFSPYFDGKCLNDFPDIKQRLHQYNQCCRGMALKIISCFANKNVQLNDNIQAFQKIPNLANGVDYDFCFNLQEKPGGSLLSFLQNFYKNISSSNSVINADSFNQYYQSFVENVENDILLQFTWNHPVGIDMLDICLQNTPGHYYKIAAIEPYRLNVLKTIKHFTLTHPLADGDFHLIGPKVGQFNEEQRKSLGFEIFETDLCSDDEPLSDIYKNRDVIVLDRVLHRQKNVVKYLRKIGELLENNGFLMVSEVTDNFETALLVDFFENHFQSTNADNVEESRIYDTFLKHDDWLKVFETAGYHVIAYRGDDLMTSIYILRKIKTQPLKPCFIYVNDFREFSWIERVQKELELRVNDPPENTIVLFANETRDSGLGGLAQSFREEYVKKNRIRVFNDISMIAHDGSSAIDIKDSCVQDQLKFDLLINSFRDGKWGTIRRFLFAEDEINLFDDTEHAVINTTVHGDLSSLSWITSANKFFDFKPDKNDDVEMVSVYYAALNFRDVMVASGRLAGDFIPKVKGLDEDCLLGIEFVGRFNKSGSRVMGISPIAQAFATTVIGDKRFCWDVPDEWTLKQAATVPVAYSTAYYSLLVRGEMERGETVLIHAGTGSVGLAAITLALAYSCKVFTTCSSREKKQFLLDRFPQLDETCIGNSRNQDFELQIMQITNGRGVDLILNSLSETLLRASVRCLARNGRFLEIGKFDLAMNNSLAMEMFAKNATFHGIVMDLLSYPLNQGWELATRKLAEGIKSGIVVPLPATVFDMNRPEEAFRFIAQGKHVGKVLLQIRQEERDIVALPKPIFVKAHRRTYCHPQHVYLLIGGLGGIGLELGHWLINRGAKKLLFTSRFGVKTGYQKRCLEFWKKARVLVKVSTLNVVNLNETYELIKEANRLGHVGGVFNLSMVLKDTLFENQTVKNFQDTCAPKVDGTTHLDKVTRELCKGHEMKWFVYFSSLVSGRGNVGQTAYAFANCCCERIIEQRRYDGYPGISIQWGAIADVGAIINNVDDNQKVIAGSFPQRIASCLQTLDLLLSTDKITVASFVRADVKANVVSTDEDVIDAIARILGVHDSSQLNHDTLLIDLGLDSLMGVEIKQMLERNYEVNLSMKDIRTLSLAKLRTLVKNSNVNKAATGSAEIEKSTSPVDFKMDRVFATRFRIKFNELVPDNPCLKLNSNESGGNVFFVHPIEGLADNVIPLAKNLEYPVYCFQLTKDAPTDTIENLAQFYVKIMKSIQPKGPYRILGYSYGTVIAFEMALQLQQQKSDYVSSLILMDASHVVMKQYFKAYRNYYHLDNENVLDQTLFESEVLCHLLLHFVVVDYVTILKRLLSMPSMQSRIDSVLEILLEHGFSINDKTVIRFGVEAYLKKILMLEKYNPSKMFDGDITLIRSLNEMVHHSENTNKDFGLKEAITGTVHVQFVEGDHDTFIQENGAVKCARIIMPLLL